MYRLYKVEKCDRNFDFSLDLTLPLAAATPLLVHMVVQVTGAWTL